MSVKRTRSQRILNALSEIYADEGAEVQLFEFHNDNNYTGSNFVLQDVRLKLTVFYDKCSNDEKEVMHGSKRSSPSNSGRPENSAD